MKENNMESLDMILVSAQALQSEADNFTPSSHGATLEIVLAKGDHTLARDAKHLPTMMQYSALKNHGKHALLVYRGQDQVMTSLSDDLAQLVDRLLAGIPEQNISILFRQFPEHEQNQVLTHSNESEMAFSALVRMAMAKVTDIDVQDLQQSDLAPRVTVLQQQTLSLDKSKVSI
ncbi:MAG: hypothetical protein K2P84_11880 [Undibacterium sp.]|nr:hypothetical protein [Undibacterium sp.]